MRASSSAAGQLGVMACVVTALLSMVVRFYRSRGEERPQLKWFTYAATVGVTTPLLLGVLAPAAFEVLGRLVWTLGFLCIPVSAAVLAVREAVQPASASLWPKPARTVLATEGQDR